MAPRRSTTCRKGPELRGLRVLLLGRPRLEVDGQALAAELPLKHQALLYYLAAADGPVGRAELAALLWEDLDEAAARGNLRTALMRLRRALPGVLAADGREVGFDAAMPVQVDWLDLARASEGRGDRDTRAAAARGWRGSLLEGFDLGGDAFERWLSGARSRAQTQAVGLRRALALEAAEAGRTADAEAHWRALLEVDDADEDAHVALMTLLSASGRRTAAIAQYEACRAALRDRMGARPSATCYALYTRIHADAPTPVADATPAVSAPPPPSPATPATPASPAEASPVAAPLAEGPLVGREAELALLTERLADPDCRWLTLVGPGGVGKTRLAVAAAAALAPRFRHGMLWISGRDADGPLRDPETLAQRVAERTGADRLQPEALLLVLDNLETAREPAALARLLRERAPGVSVLATSRRRLGGPREWLLELPGLSLERTRPDRPASSPAAQLLAGAVRRLDPHFDAQHDADGIERLCEQVGGLPLALELAARGIVDAGLPAVLARLADGASLEDRGRDDALRQHSIETVLRDSWVLLPPPAQAGALRLAWLPGAFDLPLATAIGVPDDVVQVLREHSWPRRPDAGALALHPLQQAFLRRQPAAAALQPAVRAALADAVRAALPALGPLADWPADAPPAAALAARPLFAASVLGEALAHMLDATERDLASWVDGVVALLAAADRLAEVVALLAALGPRADVAPWRRAGWQMRRAEALNALGDAVASAAVYESALATLGLDGPLRSGSGWSDLPAGLLRSWRLRLWPTDAAEHAAFARLVQRSMAMLTQQLSFTPEMDRSIRANVLANVLAHRAGLGTHGQAVRVMSAFGAVTSGQPAVARALLRSAAHRRVVTDDPLFEAFTRLGLGATRIALGQWAGVADELIDVCSTMERLGSHRHAMECHSLVAKLFFYQGELARAAERFAESTELSLRRPGGTWRAWGPFGQAETAWCLDSAPLATLQHWVGLGSHWMTEMHNLDAAYALRRAGLMARLAWRSGDVGRAREAVLGGVAAGRRIGHCGFWAHEGFAGIGEVLLALHAHEQRLGGALGPLDDAWQAFDRRLGQHGRGFPAGEAMVHRLRGQAAQVRGRMAAARRHLLEAVRAAEAQGLRVELARSCAALAEVEPAAGWSERAARLWADMATNAAPARA